MRSLPSKKVSAMAIGCITKAATVWIENWFERGQSPLSSSMREDRLWYSSVSNMIGVEYKTAMNAVEAAA